MREAGLLNQQQLVLGNARFSLEQIADAGLRENELSLIIEDSPTEPPVKVVIVVHDKKAVSVKRLVDHGLSRRRVKRSLEQLSREPGEILVREVCCPKCQAMILLEGTATPQFYCRYCESIITEFDEQLQQIELDYQLCSRCEMYSRPRKFTVFFFYFVVYFGGIHVDSVYCCPGCFRKTAWSMLFGNLPFLIGVPVAIQQLRHCYWGAIRSGPFRGLHEANKYLKVGKIPAALSLYEEILQRHPLSAGVKYNIALGLARQNDHQHAVEMLELALQDCQNYVPAQQQLVETLLFLGRNEQAQTMIEKYRLEPSGFDDSPLILSES